MMIPTYKEKLGVRLLRELRTVTAALDNIAAETRRHRSGHLDPAAQGSGVAVERQRLHHRAAQKVVLWQLASGPVPRADSARKGRVSRGRTAHGGARTSSGSQDAAAGSPEGEQLQDVHV